jgi:outer membrane receptor for ferrienterochelin and colicins
MDRGGQEFLFHEFASTPSGGRTDHDDDRLGRFYASLHAGDLKLNGLYATRTKHLPTGAWDSIFDDPDTRTIDTRDFVEAVYSPKPEPGLDLTVRAFLDRYSSHGIWPYDASVDSTLGMEGRVISRDESDVLWGGADVRAGWRASSAHRLTGGGGFHLDHATLRNLYQDVPPGQDLVNLDIDEHTSFFSVYAQEEYTPKSLLSLTLGLHYDRYESQGGTVTPRAGLVVGPFAGTRGKLLYGQGFRAPSIGEIFYDDGATEVANPELEPERITSYEGVLERTWAAFLWTRASVYRNEMTDLIQLVMRDDGMLQYRNDGSVNVNGIEFDVRAIPWRGVTGRGNVSYQDAEDAVTGGGAWNSPKWTANAGATLLLWKHRFTVGLDARYVGDRIGANGMTADGYAAADANLIWHTPVSGLQVGFKLDNLTDQAYADPAADGQTLERIPQYSRTWRLTVRFSPGSRSAAGEERGIDRATVPTQGGPRREFLTDLEERSVDR